MTRNTRNDDERRGDILDMAAFQAFMHEDEGDNEARRRRLLKNLPIAVDELSPRQRQILAMRFYQNMRVTDIAVELGISKSAVSKSLSRSISTLFKVLRYSL